MMKKQNCWEVKKCGRELGGFKSNEFGVCPAADEQKADGVHNGKNGGRCCWVVAGTLCNVPPNARQGSYVKKFSSNCHECDFYCVVKREEESQFKIGLSILKEIYPYQ